MKYADLIPFATVRQLEFIEALETHGSNSKAARALSINTRTLQRSMETLRKAAASKGYSPEHHMTKTVPDGFIVKGTSSYFDQDGKLKGQWVKSTIDQERQAQIIKEAYECMADELPRLAPVKAKGRHNRDLATVYTLTDAHVGALCWHKEGGADWDLKIAEATLTGCFEHMIQSSPAAEVGIVSQLGDFLHQDSIQPVTPTSQHLLDADGRFTKVVQVAVRVLRRVITMALEKHNKVVVLLAEGNHDLSSSIWLRCMFAAMYEEEPRIEVIDSALPYYTYQHGKTMLCWHHGHLKKNDQLPMLFASQFPKVWGETVKRYAHTGHRHHVEEKEHSGMTVIQHPTLAARDAYAARGGWIAERQASAITYHREFGQIGRVTVTPEMLA